MVVQPGLQTVHQPVSHDVLAAAVRVSGQAAHRQTGPALCPAQASGPVVLSSLPEAELLYRLDEALQIEIYITEQRKERGMKGGSKVEVKRETHTPT